MRGVGFLLGFLGGLSILLIGIFFLTLAFGLVSVQKVTTLLETLYASEEIRLFLGLSGGAVLLMTFLLLRLFLSQRQQERTIAFRNPEGEVTVTLFAIEEFIRKLVETFPGVKEMKPRVKATGGGILITVQTTLWSHHSIPETTEGLQNVIRDHIHDILGVEEPITIHVHVAKIIPRPKGREDVIEEKVVI